MNIPSDPVMLLSFLNLQLRDYHPSFEELCAALNLNRAEIEKKLAAIDYVYDAASNQFK